MFSPFVFVEKLKRNNENFYQFSLTSNFFQDFFRNPFEFYLYSVYIYTKEKTQRRPRHNE